MHTSCYWDLRLTLGYYLFRLACHRNSKKHKHTEIHTNRQNLFSLSLIGVILSQKCYFFCLFVWLCLTVFSISLFIFSSYLSWCLCIWYLLFLCLFLFLISSHHLCGFENSFLQFFHSPKH